ncbi:hypothetical protein [Niallia circulans]|uniref:hypothetical protein n=1 Tax=Niallia circulans TaxID=1397 RepID=UPI0035238208
MRTRKLFTAPQMGYLHRVIQKLERGIVMYFQPYYAHYGQQSFLPQYRMVSLLKGGESRMTPPSIGGGAVPPSPPSGGGILPPFPGGEQPPPPVGGSPAYPDAPPIGWGTDPGSPQLNQSQASTSTVESMSIRPCMFRFTYIWLENGKGFWFFPTLIGLHSIAGYRWQKKHWIYYGTDTNRIRSFQCM